MILHIILSSFIGGSFVFAGGGNVTSPTTSAAPNGPAGGDLTGTYPNPTVAANAITDSKVSLTTGAISNGAFGDNRVGISTNGITAGKFDDNRVSVTTGAIKGGFNAASQLVQMDSSAKLPAVDGSQLTNLPPGETNTFSSSKTFIGSVLISTTQAQPFRIGPSSVTIDSNGNAVFIGSVSILGIGSGLVATYNVSAGSISLTGSGACVAGQGIGWSADSGTNICRPNTDLLSFRINGSRRLTFSGTDLDLNDNSTTRLLLANGTAASPAIAWSASTGNGIYHTGNNDRSINFVCGSSVECLRATNLGVVISSISLLLDGSAATPLRIGVSTMVVDSDGNTIHSGTMTVQGNVIGFGTGGSTITSNGTLTISTSMTNGIITSSNIFINTAGVATFTPSLSSYTATASINSYNWITTTLSTCVAGSTITFTSYIGQSAVQVGFTGSAQSSSLGSALVSGINYDGALTRVMTVDQDVASNRANIGFVYTIVKPSPGVHNVCLALAVSAGTGTTSSSDADIFWKQNLP